METRINIVVVTLKSNNNPLFTITCKNNRELSEEDLRNAVKYHYDKYYENVQVSIVPEIGHFTNIKISFDRLDKKDELLLSWTFLSNVIL